MVAHELTGLPGGRPSGHGDEGSVPQWACSSSSRVAGSSPASPTAHQNGQAATSPGMEPGSIAGENPAGPTRRPGQRGDGVILGSTGGRPGRSRATARGISSIGPSDSKRANETSTAERGERCEGPAGSSVDVEGGHRPPSSPMGPPGTIETPWRDLRPGEGSNGQASPQPDTAPMGVAHVAPSAATRSGVQRSAPRTHVNAGPGADANGESGHDGASTFRQRPIRANYRTTDGSGRLVLVFERRPKGGR